jgi:hypothetical protein
VRQVNPELLADYQQQQHGNLVHMENDFGRNDRHGSGSPSNRGRADEASGEDIGLRK